MTILRALLALRRAAIERDRAKADLEALEAPPPNWPVRGFFYAEFHERAQTAACDADAAWFDAAVDLATALFPRR